MILPDIHKVLEKMFTDAHCLLLFADAMIRAKQAYRRNGFTSFWKTTFLFWVIEFQTCSKDVEAQRKQILVLQV